MSQPDQWFSRPRVAARDDIAEGRLREPVARALLIASGAFAGAERALIFDVRWPTMTVAGDAVLLAAHGAEVPRRGGAQRQLEVTITGAFGNGLDAACDGNAARCAGERRTTANRSSIMMMTRGHFFAGAAAAAGALAVAPSAARAANAAPLTMRWYGGGVYELATPGDADIVLVDAWIWNNTGFARFGIPKPPELASAAAYVAHLKSRNPKNVVVALTHDHGDHAGDYLELLRALVDGGAPFVTAGQSDLMRVGFAPKFRDAGLDASKIVVNGGAGMNFGGQATAGGVTLRLVPAVHSTALGYPPAGFIIDIAGTRVYASGDTDEFGDMALIGKRYAPQLAVVCAGGGPYTMNPEEAADAVRTLGAPVAVPVHFAHNPQVLGPEAGERFDAALQRVAPKARATVLKPGGRTTFVLQTVG